MSNVNVVEQKYRNKIENILVEHSDKPYLRSFMNYMSNSSVRTKYNYLNMVIRFMENKRIEDLTFDDFNNYIEDISYKENGEKKTSSFLITNYSAIKLFCEYLSVSKKIDENYMLYIKRPKAVESQKTIEKREIGFLTEKEIKQLLKNVDLYCNQKNISDCWKSRDKAIIYTFLNTGIRCSALMTITIDDVDLINKKLMVTDKGSKVKEYYLSENLCDVLAIWIKYRSQIDGIDKVDALFVSGKIEMMSVGSIYNVIKKYSSCIEGKNITPHKLRATYGTQLYNKTGDIYFVQDCMGHNSPKTTELYAREKKQNTKKASDIMANILK